MYSRAVFVTGFSNKLTLELSHHMKQKQIILFHGVRERAIIPGLLLLISKM